MAIITISKQIGSLGGEIASAVSERLGYQMIDKSEIHQLSSDFEQQFPTLIDSMQEETQPNFHDKLMIGRSVFKSIISSIFYEIASRNRMIIKGRGAQYILKDYPYVLCIRIIAPFDFRIANIRKKHNIDSKEAEKLVTHFDQEQSRFIQYLYRNDISNPDRYDIIYNAEKLGLNSIVENLAFQAGILEKEFPMTDEITTTLKNLSLAKRIEANIRKELSETFVKVTVQNDGEVTLTGYLFDEKEKEKVERQAQSVSGVKSIQNDIMVLRS